MSDERRPTWARVGLSALNLLAPGVGILRTGSWRLPVAFLLAILFVMALLQLSFRIFPPTFSSYLAEFSLWCLVILSALTGSIIVSWRRSKHYAERSWWSHWAMIVGVLVAYIALLNVLSDSLGRPFRPFYVPSEGMSPTLLENDKFIAAMDSSPRLRRGDLVLVEAPRGYTYIQRVAALPGDVIALDSGIVSINRKLVPQTFLRDETSQGFDGPRRARRLMERFPDEVSPHEIYDIEYGTKSGAFDNMPEQRVMPGHIFVLGDNRDRSADSRVPAKAMGLEQVPMTKVLGSALFTYWSPDATHRGTRLFR